MRFLGQGGRVLGLDIGTATTKIIVLERYRKELRIVDKDVLNNREQGFMDEQDVAEYLNGWLRERGHADVEAIVGLPQHLGVTQLTDFPPADKKLDALVAYETQQLAGISDEIFISDYGRSEPFYQYKNPVLIGVCLDNLVTHRINAVAPTGLNLLDMNMEGIALANAFLYIEPEARDRKELLLLMEIGAVNTTFALIMEGQVFYTGSFPYGGDIFTDAFAAHHEISQDEAEQAKRTGQIVFSDINAPLTGCARTLSGELQAALEQWRTQAQLEDVDLPIGGIYLCGGASLLPGLTEFFQTLYECPVQRFTVTYQTDVEVAVLLPVAYGLALQGVDRKRTSYPLSLAPPDVRTMAIRRQNYPLLAASSFIVTLLLISGLIVNYVTLSLKETSLREELRELTQCEDFIPRIERIRRDLKYFNAMFVPFVARANRNHAFVESMYQLGETQSQHDWLVYLADADVYNSNSDRPEEVEDEEAAEDGAPPAKQSMFAMIKKKEEVEPPSEHFLATVVNPWKGLKASGLTYNPDIGKGVMHNVETTLEELNTNADSIFAGADALARDNTTEFDIDIRDRWASRFAMQDFGMDLPFKQLEFDPEKFKKK